MSTFVLKRLREEFFAELEQRRWAECAALLQAARQQERSLVDDLWIDYLECIVWVEKAPPRWDQAAVQLQRLLVANPPQDLLARIHLEIAFGADYLGDYPAAVEHNQRSLCLFEALGDEIYQAKVLRNLGVAHGRAFQRRQQGPEVLQEALNCCQRSQVLAQRQGAGALAANIELQLGNIAQWQGRWDDALLHYQTRSEWCRQAGGAQRSLALALNNSGEVHHHGGDWRQAETCFGEALAILGGLPAGDPYEEADVWANLALAQRALGDLVAAGRASDKAIRLIESLLHPLEGQAARIGFFGSRVPVYEQRVELELQRGRAEEALTMLERAKSRAFLELLARRGGQNEAGEENSRGTQPLPAAEIQAGLPDDTLLIEYFITARRSVAFLVSAHGLQVVSLVDDLDQRLRPVFEWETKRLKRATPDEHGRLHEPFLLSALRQMLWAPLAAAIKGWQRLIIIPYGDFHYLPFSAFVDQPFAPADVPDFQLAPSASVFLDRERFTAPGVSAGALVVHYGPDLKYAQFEAEAVAHKLAAQLLTGDAATRAQVMADAENFSLLHFACHGCFDARQPLESGLNLADGRLTAAQIMADMRLRADLVALSGCDTGRTQRLGGDELMGLVRAFLAAGARAVLVSLWPVDDVSTRILMERFYEDAAAGKNPAAALRNAQLWLRQMTTDELAKKLAADGLPVADIEAEVRRLQSMSGVAKERVFDHPYFWAPFMLVGGWRGRS